MSTASKAKRMIKSVVEIPQKFIKFTTNGISRIFSPSDDDYPNQLYSLTKVNPAIIVTIKHWKKLARKKQ